MGTRRRIRQLAMQAMYQLDARGGDADWTDVEQAILDAPNTPEEQAEAMTLARSAWQTREQADALSEALAPDWPARRQPVVDRSILRLAFYEMTALDMPAAIVINEAVELAKAFGTDRSPSFINGVLDKMARRVRDGEREAAAQEDAVEKLEDSPEI